MKSSIKLIVALLSITSIALANDNANQQEAIKIESSIGITKGLLMSGLILKNIENLKKAADAGNETALYLIAKKYYCGEGVTQNLPIALDYLEKLSEHGSSIAPWLVGIAYRYGHGIPKDPKKALHYLEKSGKRGNPYAANLIIKSLTTDLNDYSKLNWWLNFTSDHGEPKYQRMYANELSKSNNPSDHLASYYWLLEAAQQEKYKNTADTILIEKTKERVDSKMAEIIKYKVENSGKFKWQDWNKDAMTGHAFITPCIEHLRNTELLDLLGFNPRY